MMRGLLPFLLVAVATPSLAQPAAETTAITAPVRTICLGNRDIRAKALSAADGYYARTSRGWWRNTGRSCSAYAPTRALMTQSTQDRQCRGDLVVVFDAFSRIEYGACVLGDWVRVDGPPPKK